MGEGVRFDPHWVTLAYSTVQAQEWTMGRSEAVLVVDDDRDLRTALVAMLEAEGHTVIEAEHGLHALHAMAEAPPQLIILDLTMPIMDGRVFLQEKAKTRYSRIPVVVFSSSAAAGIEQMPDVVSVVHKLAGVDALLGAVKEAAAAISVDPRPTRPARSKTFATLQAQLLRLRVLEPASGAVCSICSLALPLFRDVRPGQCLRCLGRARGFSFTDSHAG